MKEQNRNLLEVALTIDHIVYLTLLMLEKVRLARLDLRTRFALSEQLSSNSC